MSSMNCPNCSQIDAVFKVSSVYEGGTSSHQQPVTHVSKGSSYTTYETVTTRTHLAQKLAPPGMQSILTIWQIIVMMFFWSIIDFVVSVIVDVNISSGRSGPDDIFFKWMFVFLFLAVLMLLSWIRISQIKEAKKIFPYWQAAYTKWTGLYYCNRCDCCFNPYEAMAIPANNLQQYCWN